MVQGDSIIMFPILDLNRLSDVLHHVNVKHNKVSNVTGTLWHAKGLIDDTVPFDMKFIETLAYRIAVCKYEDELSKYFDMDEGITYDGWYAFSKNRKRFIEDYKNRWLKENTSSYETTGEWDEIPSTFKWDVKYIKARRR